MSKYKRAFVEKMKRDGWPVDLTPSDGIPAFVDIKQPKQDVPETKNPPAPFRR